MTSIIKMRQQLYSRYKNFTPAQRKEYKKIKGGQARRLKPDKIKDIIKLWVTMTGQDIQYEKDEKFDFSWDEANDPAY